MNKTFVSNRAGLSPLLASDFLLSTLAVKNGRRSTGQLASDVKAYLTKDQALAAFAALVKNGYVAEQSGRATLTKAGANRVKDQFGQLPSGEKGRERLEGVVWPALVLGIDPASRTAGRLARAENLRAVVLTTILGLPLEKETATLNEAISTLLVRALSGLGGLPQVDDVLKTRARSLGNLSDVDELRKGIALFGLSLGDNLHPAKISDDEEDIDAFAQRVQAVANALSTPPFSRKVAISQVYDAYGKRHADAGRLDAFKERLLKANASGVLNLYPLDEPEALDADVRARSIIETRGGRYHFIARSS